MSQTGGSLWPADIIHVNEDGWVLINRGSQHGVSIGLRLLVVGTGIRDLHNLFAPEGADTIQPPALRIRRTYELLEVVHAEADCAIAIAARTPVERRPTVYRGPEGELLVWVPLPEGYTWPPPGDSSAATEQQAETPPWAASADDRDTTSDEDADAPPEQGPQDDELWEEALPLNSVSVGDIVLPAIPAVPATPSAPSMPSIASTTPAPSSATGNAPSGGHKPSSPFEQGRTYDWMKKPGD